MITKRANARRQTVRSVLTLLMCSSALVAPGAAQAAVLIQNLGALGGLDYASYAKGVSDDGSVVVGSSDITSGNDADWSSAFMWTSGGMTDLGYLGLPGSLPDNKPIFSAANGVSADGSAIVGYSITTSGYAHAFRWTSGGGMIDLGNFGGAVGDAQAQGISGDGAVIVGSSIVPNGHSHAVTWTTTDSWATAVVTDLGTLVGAMGDSTALGVSTDGSIIVGASQEAGGHGHATMWSGGTAIDLGTIGGFVGDSYAYNVSGDGSTVVGVSELAGGAAHAFRWTDTTGMVDLGTLGNDDYSQAQAASADGKIIVGYSIGTTSVNGHGFIWTAEAGMRDLNAVLAGAGVNMTGITVQIASGISRDGQFIVGEAAFPGDSFYTAFIARATPDFAAITTPGGQQESVDNLGLDRLGAAVQAHGFASRLLGDDKPLGALDGVNVYGSVGSAAGGVSGKVGFGSGFSLLGGISLNQERYKDVSMNHALIGALALRYVGAEGALHPFAEVGGWGAPDGSFDFRRTYQNGAGSSSGRGSADGSLGYLFARAGVGYDVTATDEAVVSLEVGRNWFHTDAYVENTDPSNPFPASVSSGTDRFNAAKLGAKWTHRFTDRIDATVWGAGAQGFGASSDVKATVPAVGTLSPKNSNPRWVEYGARVGYGVSESVRLNLFVNGVAGRDSIHTETHAGAELSIAL
ncbi:MAG: hypothetical protein P4L72_07165 [Parvibaculum sp.]|uniref:hypothetical protein n=1 Tax=Parvibaculum sp. TaxID=2024848 RepID=UPI00284EAF2A|nr:hypothetical protein [Parvibaculum sp.]MDR3498990.1 hypothetical protein [Parvibaculum sp.]